MEGKLNQQPIIDKSAASFENNRRNFFYGTGCFYELTKWVVIALIVLSLVHFFIATIAIVDGASMEPNFHTGDIIIINRFQFLFGQPGRGDATVLKFPGDPEHKKYIKRIIGLPGEKIEIKDSKVYINGRLLKESYIPDYFVTMPNVVRTLRAGEYFLMGDNRPNSSDSRVWGIAAKRFLMGKTWFELYPKPRIIEQVKYWEIRYSKFVTPR